MAPTAIMMACPLVPRRLVGGRLSPANAKTPAAIGIATTLWPVAQTRFWIIFVCVALDGYRQATTYRGYR